MEVEEVVGREKHYAMIACLLASLPPPARLRDRGVDTGALRGSTRCSTLRTVVLVRLHAFGRRGHMIDAT